MSGIEIDGMQQLELFACVRDAYSAAPPDGLANDQLYETVATRAGVSRRELGRRSPIGRAGAMRSTAERATRWQQQTLKRLGLLERVDGVRGVWRLTAEGKRQLRRINPGFRMLAFSTHLGLAIWGRCEDVFPHIDVPITLALTSPPYPLRQPRAYGNPSEQEFVDFVCRAFEPIVRNLVAGGSICLNVTNDIFMRGLPSRSLYLERLVLALSGRLGLALMDRLIWHNPSKPPGPAQWASVSRVQLNVAYEPIYWFTNDPTKVKADNRRVLEPHTDRHLGLIAAGGERRQSEFGDGAYRINPGDFRNPTAGRIPRNVIVRGHSCADQNAYRRAARGLGLPVHAAAQPLAIARFLVEFLSSPGDLVVDPFSGSLTTAKAAEELARLWMATESIWEYLRGGAERFRHRPGFKLAA